MQGITRWLLRIERVGNRLPDPVTLFLLFIAVLVLLSVLASGLGLSALHPGTAETITAENLLQKQWVQKMLVEMPQTFMQFPPLGLVLVMMLGISVAEKSGLIDVVLQRSLLKLPPAWLTSGLVFLGIQSSLAADAGYVVLIPLGAAVFASVGRHPLAGLAAAFAGVSAGFSANLLLTSLDPLLAGLTQAAMQLVGDVELPITINYYLMVALVPLFTLAATLVTHRVIEPYLAQGDWQSVTTETALLTVDQQQRGLRFVLLVTLLFVLLIGLGLVSGGWLRDAQDGLTVFYQSLVALLAIGFFSIGLAYAIGSRQVKSDTTIVTYANDGMRDMASYIVLAFVAAHFIALFKWSNLGLITAVKGAELLQSLPVPAWMLLLGFIGVSSLINLVVGSASAKWAIMAPVFVPMLFLAGYPPELTQAAFRIGDSVTNILTPLLPYFPLVLITAQRYQPNVGIGSLIALMLPYSMAMGLVGTATLLIWFLTGWPLGPG